MPMSYTYRALVHLAMLTAASNMPCG